MRSRVNDLPIRLRTPVRKYPALSGIEGLGVTNSMNPFNVFSGPQMPTDKVLQNIATQLSAFSATQVLKRTMIPRSITIGTTPTQVILSKSLKGYLILNQSSALASGTPSTGTLLASAARSADGNSQSSPLGVANYSSAHLYLDITANTGGTIDIYIQSQDPASGNWCDSGLIFANTDTLSAVGTYYAYIGSNGLASQLAARWDVLTAGTFTFSIGYVLKDALPGSSAGVARTVYLGSNNGVTTASGFPLLEGQSWAFYMEQNSELWAVAQTSTILNVLELQ